MKEAKSMKTSSCGLEAGKHISINEMCCDVKEASVETSVGLGRQSAGLACVKPGHCMGNLATLIHVCHPNSQEMESGSKLTSSSTTQHLGQETLSQNDPSM